MLFFSALIIDQSCSLFSEAEVVDVVFGVVAGGEGVERGRALAGVAGGRGPLDRGEGEKQEEGLRESGLVSRVDLEVLNNLLPVICHEASRILLFLILLKIGQIQSYACSKNVNPCVV